VVGLVLALIVETMDTSLATIEEIEEMLRKALLVGALTYDMGSQYFINWPERLSSRIARQEEKIVATGITELDELLGGGLKARQLGLWMAPTSRGKSIALVHCGKRAIINPEAIPRRFLRIVCPMTIVTEKLEIKTKPIRNRIIKTQIPLACRKRKSNGTARIIERQKKYLCPILSEMIPPIIVPTTPPMRKTKTNLPAVMASPCKI
jgi:hypothetical protein